MKLFRTDLITGFTDRLFEIPVDSLDKSDLVFSSCIIRCLCSSESFPNGFKIKGTLTVPYLFECDRCLDMNSDEWNIPFTVWVTEDTKLIDEVNMDTLFFPKTADEIDLMGTIYDLIHIEIPVKYLCSNSCKGICVRCGTNLNHQSCKCLEQSENTVLEA